MIAAVIIALRLARNILIPLAFALTLTFLLTPVVSWLEKLRLGRAASVLIAVALSIGIAGGIGFVLTNQLVEVASELPAYQENINSKLEALHAPTKGSLGRAAASVQQITKELSKPSGPQPPTAEAAAATAATRASSRSSSRLRPIGS
ncbi:MAG TPA: AI-2E family transporter [Bryobacteraceae bacterium]|nr:AI-2E family transporter [Bryobacteraceae bacterium]